MLANRPPAGTDGPPENSSHSRMDERELLFRLRQGDDAAYEAIFRQWYAPLVAMGAALLRDRGPAEEVVQDVMLELWRRRESLTFETSLRAYLFQATRNRALNVLRRQRVETRGESTIVAGMPTPEAADSEARESELNVAIQSAIAGLPDRCREVFELSRIRGLKYTEIASELGISVKTVEAQMGKALRIMREKLAPWLPEGETL
ncbi:MAG TPA: RNA polymerase sigma-70 factor [Gemmatimonadaceae bacterium]|nr:RNA polymerase sigma-70 factor [Gemmatimonadaceae bacterium]